VIKSRKLKWEEHVARRGESRDFYRVLVGNPREGDQWEDRRVDGNIILKWILEKWDGRGMDWISLAQGMDKWRTPVNAVINLRVS
jgi:hypothetical protein